MFSILPFEGPPEGWVTNWHCSPVPLSHAYIFTIPLASISKVTSIWGIPLGAGTHWAAPQLLLLEKMNMFVLLNIVYHTPCLVHHINAVLFDLIFCCILLCIFHHALNVALWDLTWGLEYKLPLFPSALVTCLYVIKWCHSNNTSHTHYWMGSMKGVTSWSAGLVLLFCRGPSAPGEWSVDFHCQDLPPQYLVSPMSVAHFCTEKLTLGWTCLGQHLFTCVLHRSWWVPPPPPPPPGGGRCAGQLMLPVCSTSPCRREPAPRPCPSWCSPHSWAASLTCSRPSVSWSRWPGQAWTRVSPRPWPLLHRTASSCNVGPLYIHYTVGINLKGDFNLGGSPWSRDPLSSTSAASAWKMNMLVFNIVYHTLCLAMQFFLTWSSDAYFSASYTMFSILPFEIPPEGWITICCCFPVPLTHAYIFTIPLASISKVTSIWGIPLGAGTHWRPQFFCLKKWICCSSQYCAPHSMLGFTTLMQFFLTWSSAASFTMFSILPFESPPWGWITNWHCSPVPLSDAYIFTIPLVSISKVTSIWGTPLGAGTHWAAPQLLLLEKMNMFVLLNIVYHTPCLVHHINAVLFDLIFCCILLCIFHHALNVALWDLTWGLEYKLPLFPSALVTCLYIHYTVGINLKGDFNLGGSPWSRDPLSSTSAASAWKMNMLVFNIVYHTLCLAMQFFLTWSSDAYFSASYTMFSILPFESWITICCCFPVPLSRAYLFTIPLASISKVTSIWGIPYGAGTHWGGPQLLLIPYVAPRWEHVSLVLDFL